MLLPFLLIIFVTTTSTVKRVDGQQIGVGGALNPQGYQSHSRVDNPFEVFGTAETKLQEMCFVGSEVADDNLNNRNAAFLLLCPSLTSVCDGSVREWIFNSGADDNTPAYLGFFRRASNDSIQLIGYNRVRGSQLGRHSVQIREGSRINVLKNDFVGVFYESFMSDYSVVAYQRYARTFAASRNKKLQSCYAANFTYSDLMRLHGRIQGLDDLDAEPTLISLQAVVDRHPLFSCYAGPDPRSFSAMRSPTWLVLMPAASFPCAGRVIRWEILSVAAALHTISVYLSVWRFATNATWTSPSVTRQILQRIAYQQVLVDRNGFMSLEGDDLYDIYVQKGDFIGIYFEAPNADSGVPIMTDMATMPSFTDQPEDMTTPGLIFADAADALFPDVTQEAKTTTTPEPSTLLAELLRFGEVPTLSPAGDSLAGVVSMAPNKKSPDLDWCILSKTYREKIDSAMDIGTLSLYDFKIRKCAAAVRAFVKDFTLTDCGMPPNVDNAQQFGNTSFETSVVTYECDPGYLLVGDPAIVCQSNGLWTSPPDCVESFERSGLSPCYFPPAVEHAEAKLNTLRTELNKMMNRTVDHALEPVMESIFATYRCKTGYVMVGRPDVECKPPGQWSDLPKCAEIKHACKAGKVVQSGGAAEEAHLMAFMKLRFTCSGEIHTWEYYSNSSEGEVIFFDVWRKIDNGQYRLVGSNSFPALQRGRVIQPVEANDRVRVAAGDFIGMHYVTTKVTPVVPVFNTRTAGDLARLLGDTFIVDLNEAALESQTMANQGYLDLRRLSRVSLRLPPIIAYATALPGCGLPTEVAHAKYLAKSTAQGSVASYECNKGYELRGSKDAFCRSPNTWTNPPVCLPVELCRTGPKLHNQTLANKASFLNIFLSMRFPCGGVVSEWQFYSDASQGTVYFGVWRYIADQAFELVGVNKVKVNGTGLQTYYVRGEERITVLQDYLVGIHYEDPFLPQEQVVVSHADETKPAPYTVDDLYDGWAFDVGHDDLIKMGGRILLKEKSEGLRKKWRIPAVNPIVRRALVSCGLPPTVPNSALMGREITQYATRQYRCDNGYFLVGPENITCRTSGRWTEPPLCVNGCVWGKAIPEKEFNSRSQKNALSIFVSKPLKCRGFVKSWSFFSIVDEPARLYFDVWRRNGTQQMYLLIGSNRVNSNGYGLQTVEISVEQQIFVEANDVVGIHYDIMTPPIVAEAEPDDNAYHPSDLYDVLEEMDYGLINPGTLFLLAPIKIRKAAKLPSMSVTVLNYQARPYGLCESDTTCPKNAECVLRDNRHSVCMCSSGFWLRYDGMACLPAAGISEPCDESVACESQVMTCNADSKTCECITGWTPSADGQRCKPVSPNPDYRYSVHGESCGNEALCYHSFRDQECRDGVCQCRRGYRWASDFERRANPETMEECRPINASQFLLPELAELCYIDQRSYYERIRRSQVGGNNQFALSKGEINVKTEAISVGDGSRSFFSGGHHHHDGSRHQRDVIQAAVISGLSMLAACGVMFAVWSWNSHQGIYNIERGIGRRLGNMFHQNGSSSSSSSSSADDHDSSSALTALHRSVRRSLTGGNLFQRFYNDLSISTTAADDQQQPVVAVMDEQQQQQSQQFTQSQPAKHRNLRHLGVNKQHHQSSNLNAVASLSQCSLNLNEMDPEAAAACSTSAMMMVGGSLSVVQIDSPSSPNSNFSNGSLSFDNMCSGNSNTAVWTVSGSMKPCTSLVEGDQFAVGEPGSTDTLTMLSTSKQFQQQTTSFCSKQEKADETVDSAKLLAETMFVSPQLAEPKPGDDVAV